MTNSLLCKEKNSTWNWSRIKDVRGDSFDLRLIDIHKGRVVGSLCLWNWRQN